MGLSEGMWVLVRNVGLSEGSVGLSKENVGISDEIVGLSEKSVGLIVGECGSW